MTFNDISLPRRSLVLGAAALACGAPRAWAAGFPDRTIRIVVPFTPGSGSDSAARFYGERMNAIFNQSVIVENKAGGNGLIAIQSVKGAPADGYSILLGNISLMAVNMVVLKDPGYDSLKDFKPLYGVHRGAAVYAVSNDSKIRTLDELLTVGRTRKLAMGTYSQGYQLACAWLASLAHVQFENIPYKGNAPLVTDLVGNQLDAALLDFGGSVSMLKSGKMRALAITSTERSPDMPDVPTVREAGFGDYQHYSWVGFFVRADTPDDVAAKLTGALQKTIVTPEARQFVEGIASEIMPLPPAQMQAFVKSEIDRFRKVAVIAGIQPQ
jgi:tripartite-type tricarboxylate transporter receptor subunit TctC